jgi:hypothetical protein
MAKKTKTKIKVKRDPSKILGVLYGAASLPKSKVRQIDVESRLAWAKLCAGTGKFKDYNTIAWVVNVVELGLEHLNSPEIGEIVSACSSKVGAALDRRMASGEWGLTDESVPEMLDLLDIHHQLVSLVTTRQLDKILDRVEKMKGDRIECIKVACDAWDD